MKWDDVSRPVDTFFEGIGSCFEVLCLLGIWALLIFGGINWVWVAIKVEDLFVLIIGLVPFSWIVTASVGAYALLFGWPNWVVDLFNFSPPYPPLLA